MIAQLLAQRNAAVRLGDLGLINEINLQLARLGRNPETTVDATPLERAVPAKPRRRSAKASGDPVTNHDPDAKPGD